MTGGEPGPAGPVDAAAVARELAELDARLAGVRAQASVSMRYRPLLIAFVAGPAALVLALLALVSVLGGVQDDDLAAGVTAAVLFGALAAALAVLTARLYRRAFAPVRAVSAERRALLARRQQLIAVLAGHGVDAAGRPVPVRGGTVPADRQPSAWATAMHAKCPLGPPPAQVLARLPADAPAWKVWLAGKVGWGVAGAVLLLVGTVLVGLVFAAALTGH